jgi:hypothetical protein
MTSNLGSGQEKVKSCVNSLFTLDHVLYGRNVIGILHVWTNKPNLSLALCGTSNDNFKRKGGFSNESFSRVFTQKKCVT